MKYIRFNEDDLNELHQILDRLDELDNKEDNLELFSIQEQIATLIITLGREFEILENEIFINNIADYNIVKRKAHVGDIVQIVNPSETSPFNHRHDKRFFKVTEEADSGLLEWVSSCVIVGYMCLYDTQYVVLEPKKGE